MASEAVEALKRHIPGGDTDRGLARIALTLAAFFLATSLFFFAADRYFPEWMPDGEIVILALGFLILSRFFSQRERYQQRYGERAYAQALQRLGAPGWGIIAASIGHLAYISGPGWPPLWWSAWLTALGWLLLLIGTGIWLRAVQAGGLDSLMMLYVYYPDEGKLIEARIYQLIRHPIYAAAQNFAFGLALIHGSWYALIVALLMPLFFAGWTRLIEEPDLTRRFPEYAAYRARVPAFSPKPGRITAFWHLLFTGS